jgi:adenylate kinase family enzyme
MEKIPLLVLLGFPGAGKTTLARAFIKKHPEFRLSQVFDFMKGKLVGPAGEILDESYVLKAHDALYKSLHHINSPIILELGTNYPRYNCKKLKYFLDKKIDLKIIFCLIDKKLCLQRMAEGLANGHRTVPMKREVFTERIKRDFPRLYQIHCRNQKLLYYELDMQKTMENNVKELEKILKI